MCRIVILAPLLPEARAVARALSLKGQFKGRVESNGEIAVVMIGPRASQLQAAQEFMPRPVILAGLGGGLKEGIRVGDLVLSEEVPLKGLTTPVHFGNICTSTQVMTNPADKMALHGRTGAIAVDMEFSAAEEFARQHRVPFLAIRAISDAVSDELDPSLLTLIDEDGRPKPTRALGMLARNPAKMGSLLRIAKASNLALSHLAAGVAAIVKSGWPADVRGSRSQADTARSSP